MLSEGEFDLRNYARNLSNRQIGYQDISLGGYALLRRGTGGTGRYRSSPTRLGFPYTSDSQDCARKLDACVSVIATLYCSVVYLVGSVVARYEYSMGGCFWSRQTRGFAGQPHRQRCYTSSSARLRYRRLRVISSKSLGARVGMPAATRKSALSLGSCRCNTHFG